MIAVLIDDEKPALLHLERLLQADGRIRVAGKYTCPHDGLEHLAAHKADVVFLDIGMPEMNGLEAAERIHRIDPDIRIVYVTAYAEYAIEAFELNALDYLLKPVDPDRFAKTLARLDKGAAVRSGLPPEAAGEPQVQFFKQLTLRDASGAGERLKWRTQKSQELFAFLIHQRGQWVTKDIIIETIWPEYGRDKGLTHLHTSVYQIRRMLKDWGVGAVIEYARDSYRFVPMGVTTDFEQFEQLLEEAQSAGEHARERLNRALKLYRGDYLEDHDYDWAKPVRAVLHRQYVRAVMNAAACELSEGRERQAYMRLRAAQEKEPFSEELVRLLMRACAAMQDYGSLTRHYQEFVRLLRNELGIEPEPKTAEVYEQLLRGLRDSLYFCGRLNG